MVCTLETMVDVKSCVRMQDVLVADTVSVPKAATRKISRYSLSVEQVDLSLHWRPS